MGRTGIQLVSRRRWQRLALTLAIAALMATTARAQTSAEAQRAQLAQERAAAQLLSQAAPSGATDGTNNPGVAGQGSSGAGTAQASGLRAMQKFLPVPHDYSMVKNSSGGTGAGGTSSSSENVPVVPDLRNKTRAEVEALFAPGPAYLSAVRVYHPQLIQLASQQCDARRGVVLDQRPPPGTPWAQAGGQVSVVFAFDVGSVDVPDLSGKSPQQASDLLRSSHLCPGTTQLQPAEVQAGMVLRGVVDGYPNGQRVPQGTVVGLVVSEALPEPVQPANPVQPPNPVQPEPLKPAPPRPPKPPRPGPRPIGPLPAPAATNDEPPPPPTHWEFGWLAAGVVAAFLLWRLLRPRRSVAAGASRLAYAVVQGGGEIRVKARESGLVGVAVQLRILRAAPVLRIEYRRGSDVRDD